MAAEARARRWPRNDRTGSIPAAARETKPREPGRLRGRQPPPPRTAPAGRRRAPAEKTGGADAALDAPPERHHHGAVRQRRYDREVLDDCPELTVEQVVRGQREQRVLPVEFVLDAGVREDRKSVV